MNPKLTELFIEGLDSKSKAIPEKVVVQAKKCLLDYMGVVVGGARYIQQQHPKFFSELAKEKGVCALFGTEYKTSSVNAALLNGFSAHVLELDDGHRMGMIHLGASINSAILAMAEQENLGHDDIIKGVVMGYEAAVRCACAVQPGHKVRGYHVSGTCGTIGSALGVAFACGFTKEQLNTSLSCAATSAAGLLGIQEDASELKPYNLGRAAMDGLLAAQVGRIALPSPDDILGSNRGLLSVMTDTPNLNSLIDFSGETYCIEGIYQKLYAACRHCHPAIEATIDIKNERGFSPKQVEKVEVHTYKLAVAGHDHKVIKGLSSAKMSIPYSVALAIVKGNAGYSDFNEDNLRDENVLSMTNKISVFEDEALTALSPAVRGAQVYVYLRDGNKIERKVLYPKGEPENPISYQDIKLKTRVLLQGYNNSYIDWLLEK